MNLKPTRSSSVLQVSGLSDKLEAALDAIAAGGTPASPKVPGRQPAQSSAAAASAPAPSEGMSSEPVSSASPSVPRRVRVMDENSG